MVSLASFAMAQQPRPNVPVPQTSPAAVQPVTPPAAPVQAAPPPPPRRADGPDRSSGRCRESPAKPLHRAPRTVAMVDVHVGRRGREGRDDRSRLCLAHHLDDLPRQDRSSCRRAAEGALGAEQDRGARSLAEAQFALGSKEGVLPSLLCGRHARGAAVGRHLQRAGIKERAASSCAEIVRAEARRVRLGMGLLATIGATSPFVGLFGTVWGIMNSFIGISKAQTTNLAVVAPGIAEALLATAIGLVAAIPAVIIYNHFARGDEGLSRTGQPRLGRRGAAVVARSRPRRRRRRIRARSGVGRWRFRSRQRIRRRGRFR